MRCLLLLLSLGTAMLRAQQLPFIPVTGANAPSGAAYIFEDHRGGLWLGGFEGFRGLRYFDGIKFTTPVPDDFHAIAISEIAEDGDGGIWLASAEQGLYRVCQGRMQKMFDSVGIPTITSVAPNLLLASLAPPGKQSPEFFLTRIVKVDGAWKAEAIAKSAQGVPIRPDGIGNVLYACDDGYCELKITDVENWRPGTILFVARHHWKLPFSGGYVTRDRLGCVWMRTYSTAFYQCPSNPQPVNLPFTVAGDGGSTIAQLDDGSIVIPSFGRLAIGRPGSFRVITMANGYPSFGSLFVGKDDTIWLSNANGLFVLPTRWRMEYWTQRDGLDGNTWSILPLGQQVFAISGDNIQKLNDDRSRWRVLREFAGATHLMAGPGGTILASSRTQGVVQFDANGRIVRKSSPSTVMMLAQAPDGQIWSVGNDLSRMNFSGDKLGFEPAMALLPQGHGMDIKIDNAGELWTCYAGGLLWGRPGDWHRLSRENGLRNDGCLSFVLDPNGDIWYGTGDLDLIQRPRSAQPMIQRFDNPNEPGYGNSYFVATDAKKRIWRGTSNGVYVADLEQGRKGRWLYLNRVDGLPGVDTNRRSFIADTDNSVWFGVDSSIVHIFPSSDFVHPGYAPTTFISRFSWNGNPFQMEIGLGPFPTVLMS